jgi:Xaa-Pro aminopeptidase
MYSIYSCLKGQYSKSKILLIEIFKQEFMHVLTNIYFMLFSYVKYKGEYEMERDVKKQISSSNVSDYSAKILPLRERAEITNKWLKHRLRNVLPKLMQREKFDMWIVSAREYNEDPVLMTLLPAPMLSARRRTILVFYLKDSGELECLSLLRPVPVMNDFYEAIFTDNRVDQYKMLADLIRERDPKSIGINVSSTFAFGDGLTFSENRMLGEALDEKYQKRCRSAERLCVAWLEHRTDDEIAAYHGINEIAHGIINEAFSSRVITPGVTTALDVAWWIRQKIRDLGLLAWFMPSVSIIRKGHESVSNTEVIMPGDVLHCDVGLEYLGICTDTQQNAYVLKLDENEPPEGLVRAFSDANRLQDIHAEEMVANRTGNEILKNILDKAKAEGLNPCVYSHPIGYHGHGAGPTIGLYDQQEGVPGRGDYELYNNTAYAMELNNMKKVPEWDDQEVRVALEQTIIFTEDKVFYLGGRQKGYHLIK